MTPEESRFQSPDKVYSPGEYGILAWKEFPDFADWLYMATPKKPEEIGRVYSFSRRLDDLPAWGVTDIDTLAVRLKALSKAWKGLIEVGHHVFGGIVFLTFSVKRPTTL